MSVSRSVVSTLCDPMDCSLPGSLAHAILQVRILEWVAIPFSRGSSQPRDQTPLLCLLPWHHQHHLGSPQSFPGTLKKLTGILQLRVTSLICAQGSVQSDNLLTQIADFVVSSESPFFYQRQRLDPLFCWQHH